MKPANQNFNKHVGFMVLCIQLCREFGTIFNKNTECSSMGLNLRNCSNIAIDIVFLFVIVKKHSFQWCLLKQQSQMKEKLLSNRIHFRLTVAPHTTSLKFPCCSHSCLALYWRMWVLITEF